MKICSNCAHENREGYLYCEDCGQPLLVNGMTSVRPTKHFELASDNIAPHQGWGTARFDRDSSVVLRINDAPEPILFRPNGQTIIGRSDNTNSQKPDLDLTPYGALEKGVSRIHSAIFRNDDTLTVIDKGSANGTFLNGQRLIPNQPRVLRDGDEIRMGKLIAHIYFKAGQL